MKSISTKRDPIAMWIDEKTKDLTPLTDYVNAIRSLIHMDIVVKRVYMTDEKIHEFGGHPEFKKAFFNGLENAYADKQEGIKIIQFRMKWELLTLTQINQYLKSMMLPIIVRIK